MLVQCVGYVLRNNVVVCFKVSWVCLVIVQCIVDYIGWFIVYLLFVCWLLLFKVDGLVSVYVDDCVYKLLNWMSLLCWLIEEFGGQVLVWVVENKVGEQLCIIIEGIEYDSSYELGVDFGLVKDGVEVYLQVLFVEYI